MAELPWEQDQAPRMILSVKIKWLSQSSQDTYEPQQRPGSYAEDTRGRTFASHGLLIRVGNPVCNSRTNPQPHQTGKKDERIKTLDTSSKNDPRSEKLLDSSSSIAAAPAAAKRAWSAAESGSDWESGRSECLSPEEPGGRGSRRLRTAFSVEQISTLESSFKRHKYLGSAERRKLAAKMQLSEVQIKTWFQNRRMKLKRQLQEMRPEPFYSPVPFGARPLPLHYVYPAQQQLLAHLPRQEAVPASFAFPALPASALSPASTFRAEPGFWQAPCFVGYRDSRAFLLPI
ncbi:homeobox protein vent1-like [Gopherus flavomarginatus]|uniref:homeobox protein vent1-like n=1 Tax=Gopherus flavomarginatus TaxID=286002 RepID=UPI0021CBE7F8|nr:homeobox protein vent1-like [Gopherus flavomarginatus]